MSSNSEQQEKYTCCAVGNEDLDLFVSFCRDFVVKIHGWFGVGVGLVSDLLRDERQHGHDRLYRPFD